MLGKRIRHTKRYQEIVNTFMRNGFSHFLFRVGITERNLTKGKESDTIDMNLQNIGVKLRHALQDLGPAFIKLGQIASSRYDVLPPEITAELEKLQDHVAFFPFEQVRDIIETELGDELENLFAYINTEPIATASIGQVHVARLFTGEEVVIKVQRPGLKPRMETDLEILQGIGRLLEERTVWAQRYRVQNIIYEFSTSLRNELDYLTEGRNAERIAKQFSNQPHVRIPEIYWDFTTKKVLTMEMVRGIKISECERLDEEGYDRKIIAKRLANAMFKQILDNGFFHGDPHAGNVYILPGNVISFLDFGVAGRISEDLKYHFASIVVNLHQGNTKAIIKTFSSMDIIGDKTNLHALKSDLEGLHQRYEDALLKEVSLGRIIIEIFNVAYRHYIEIPSDIAILSKVILTLEGVVGKLDPDFSIMKTVEPFARNLLKRRYHPKTVIRNSLHELVENIEIISNLPKDLQDIMGVIRKGKIGLDINVKQLETFLHRLDRVSNRLSFSIIMLAFSILMAGLIIGSAITGQTTMIWNLPIIEIGAIVATLMFILMIITIIKSGRM